MTNPEAAPFMSSLAHHAADPFRLLVEAVVDYAIFMLDPAGRVVSWNPGAQRIYGYRPDQIVGQPVARLFAAGDPACETVSDLETVLRQGRLEGECLRTRADGSTFWAFVTTTNLDDAFGRHVGFAQVTRDVTERKQLTHRLGERIKELSCLHGAARVLSDRTLQPSDWLRQIALLMPPAWQYPQDTVIRIAFGEVEATTPGFVSTPWVQRAEFRAADGTRGVIEVAYRRDHPPEAEGPFLLEERHLLDSLAETIRSALDRRSVESALIENEARLRQRTQLLDTLMDSLPGIVLMFAEDGGLLRWNKVFERVTGYSADEIAGLTSSDVIAAEDRPAVEQAMKLVLSTARHGVEGHLLTKDARTIPYYFEGVRLATEHGPRVLAIGIDLSERHRLEHQFRQAQKMEAVGRLAGGVAHDFNNLLTIIAGYSEMLLPELSPTDPKREMVSEIQQAADRAASLTRQLLAFSRKTILEPKVLNINDLVRENESMLRRLIGEDVELTAVLDPTLSQTRVDAGQVAQVIMNLVINARDAMPTGGKLQIETRNVQLDEHFTSHPEATAGDYVLLAVTDNGVGMAPEVQARVFEPFFTTKPQGKGTGLGLATVYGIVKQSRGFVYVYSELGHGTSLKCYFPVIDGAPEGESTRIPRTVARGSETILLVEDENAVRSIVRVVLQQAGYTVLDASRGTDALRIAAQHSGAIDLLIADVVMPGLGGRAVMEQLAPLRPQMKVLYLSGYTDDAIVRHRVLEAGVSFLQKPFTMAALTHKVRQVLDRTV